MKSMLNLLTNRYLQRGMSGLFYFELRVNCPQTMSIHQTMLMCPFESQKIWFSMVMDHWSNNAMVLMDHSPLNFHKIENFKLADPAVEGDPGIWHRPF